MTNEDVFNRIMDGAKQSVKDTEREQLGLSTPTSRNIEKQKEQREWKEQQEKTRKKHKQNPIIYYCEKIRGIVPDYEISFEKYQKNEMEGQKAREKLFQEERGALSEMNDMQKRERELRKLGKEERKQRLLDQRYVNNSPQRMFEKMINDIGCECNAEEMRVGVFCDTCVIISKVRQYMLDMFKDVAEGRTSF